MQVCKFQHGVGYVLFLNSSVYVIRMWRHIEMLTSAVKGSPSIMLLAEMKCHMFQQYDVIRRLFRYRCL
jgi:hypothetical protein